MLLRFARLGQPILVTPCALGGTTAPPTLAGLLAVQHAEVLVGLVLTQFANPGCPFLYGGTSAMIELARWLDVPNWAYGGMTDSHSLDCRAGLEIPEITLLNMMSGSNLTHDAGYQGFGLAASLEQSVVVDEFVGMNRRLLAGIEVNEETRAMGAIADVGPGGEIMSHRHTRKLCRTAQWRATVLSRESQVNWDKDGRADPNERARRKALALLASYEVAALPQAVNETMDALILEFEQSSPLFHHSEEGTPR